MRLRQAFSLVAGSARKPVAWGFGWKGLNAACSFATATVLARAAGAEAVGHFGLAVATVAIVGTLGQGGLDQVLLRKGAGNLRVGEVAAAGAVTRLISRKSLAGTVAAALGLLAIVLEGSLVARLSADRASLLVACAGVVSMPLLRLSIVKARFAGRPAFGQFIEALPSFLMLPGILIAIAAGMTLPGARIVGFLVVAQFVAVAVARAGLASSFANWGAPGEAPPFRPLLRAGLPIMATALLIAFQDWFLLVVTSAGLSAADAGALRLALQLMLIPMMIWQVGDNFLVAQIAGDLRQKDHALAWRRFWRTVRRSLLLASPIIATLVLAPDLVLRLLFGDPYAYAAPMVRLMALGQLALLTAHPVGAMLVMADRGQLLLAVGLAGILVLVGVVQTLLPTYGLLAVGLAYAASCITKTVLGLLLARRVVRPETP